MDANQYQELAMETESPAVTSQELRLMNAALGLNGEAGEVADIIKKRLFQYERFDRDHAIEELGDVLWYAAEMAKALDVTLGEVMARNLEKLAKRHEGGFNARTAKRVVRFANGNRIRFSSDTNLYQALCNGLGSFGARLHPYVAIIVLLTTLFLALAVLVQVVPQPRVYAQHGRPTPTSLATVRVATSAPAAVTGTPPVTVTATPVPGPAIYAPRNWTALVDGGRAAIRFDLPVRVDVLVVQKARQSRVVFLSRGVVVPGLVAIDDSEYAAGDTYYVILYQGAANNVYLRLGTYGPYTYTPYLVFLPLTKNE